MSEGTVPVIKHTPQQIEGARLLGHDLSSREDHFTAYEVYLINSKVARLNLQQKKEEGYYS